MINCGCFCYKEANVDESGVSVCSEFFRNCY
jgi:hypothetical protein